MNTPLLQAAMGIEEDVMSGWRGEEREGRVGGDGGIRVYVSP